MPKIKIRDLIRKNDENEKIIALENSESFNDNLNSVIANRRKGKITATLLGGINKKYGRKKLQNMVKRAFELKAEEDKSFDAKAAYDDYISRYTAIEAKHIFNKANDNAVPKNYKIKAYLRDNKIKDTGDLIRHGYDKLVTNLTKEIPELEAYLNDNISPNAGFKADEIGTYIFKAAKEESGYIDGFRDDPNNIMNDIHGYEEEEEIINNNPRRVNDPNEPTINLDDEVEEERFIYDIPEEEVINERALDKGLIDEMLALDEFKGNEEIEQQLKEISLATGSTSGNNDKEIFNICNDTERSASARGKIYGENQYNEKLKEVYNQVILPSNPATAFNVLKPENKEIGKEFAKDAKFKFSDKTKEGMRIVLNKFDEMGLQPIFREQGYKVYSLNNLVAERFKLIEKIDEIKALKDQRKEYDLADDGLELQINNQKVDGFEIKYKEDLALKTKELLELKKDYDKAKKDVDYLVDVCHEHFSDVKTINTNVDVTRSAFAPLKYRKDGIALSQLNGLYYAYSMMKRANVSVDEFLADPAKIINQQLEEDYHVSEMLPTGNEKTFKEFLTKVIPAGNGSPKDEKVRALSGAYMRSMDCLAYIDSDYDNTINNSFTYNKLYDYQRLVQGQQTNYKILEEKREKTIENLIVVGKPDLDLIEDDYYDLTKQEIVQGKGYNLDDYINNNKITEMSLMTNYQLFLDTLLELNGGKYNEEVDRQIASATKAFADASLKYMQKYRIDPEKSTNPIVKLMVKSIENTEDFLKNDMGLTKFIGANKINLNREKGNLLQLNSAKNDINNQKNLIRQTERQTINAEIEFDRQTKALKTQLDARLEELYSGDSGDRELMAAAELQRQFRNRLIEHSNYLAQRCRNGEIPEGFYENRAVQLMAGAPIGNLKFFGNKPVLSEEEYVESKKEQLNREPKEYEIDNFKAEYKAMVERYKNENEIMAERNARENNKAFENIKLVDNKPKVKDIKLVEKDPALNAQIDDVEMEGFDEINEDRFEEVMRDVDRRAGNDNFHIGSKDQYEDDIDSSSDSDDDSLIEDDSEEKKEELIEEEKNDPLNEARIEDEDEKEEDPFEVEDKKLENKGIKVIDDPENTETRQRVSIDLDQARIYEKPKKTEINKVPEKNKVSEIDGKSSVK